jgi:hypothetical protein
MMIIIMFRVSHEQEWSNQIAAGNRHHAWQLTGLSN